MPTPVELPKTGNTVEECVIGRWVKRVGEAVCAGDVLAEVETDKATFEITAPVGGTLLATFFEPGALVPVFTTVCVIGAAGESADGYRPQAAAPASSGIRDSGSGIGSQRIRRTPNPQSPITASVAASPRALRWAREHGVEIAAIAGSGPGGRILEHDVKRAHERSGGGAAPVRPSTTRAAIARRLRESLASTAQYTLNASADASGLLALRAQFKASPDSSAITVNHLITYCTIQSLLEAPDLNAELVDGRILRHRDVHIGFACDTPRGLMVPVVRDAQALRVGALARRMSDLAARALDGTISPGDLTGATFTISNLGALGIESFTPVINLPQVAILGVGAIQPKARRVDRGVEFVDAIGLSLTCDHQVIDGAPAARFLLVLKQKIEQVEYDLIMRGS